MELEPVDWRGGACTLQNAEISHGSRAGPGLAGDVGIPDAGIIKLCDFGLCADISGGHELTDFVGSPGFFAPELFCEASYRGDLADAWSLGSVVLECVLGHRAFDDLWCPPYDDLKDPNAFRDAVDAAVGRVKLGGPNGPLTRRSSRRSSRTSCASTRRSRATVTRR